MDLHELTGQTACGDGPSAKTKTIGMEIFTGDQSKLHPRLTGPMNDQKTSCLRGVFVFSFLVVVRRSKVNTIGSVRRSKVNTIGSVRRSKVNTIGSVRRSKVNSFGSVRRSKVNTIGSWSACLLFTISGQPACCSPSVVSLPVVHHQWSACLLFTISGQSACCSPSVVSLPVVHHQWSACLLFTICVHHLWSVCLLFTISESVVYRKPNVGELNRASVTRTRTSCTVNAGKTLTSLVNLALAKRRKH
ncbi:hypothetical protein EGW08_015346 [Elysia chlorotica]|uniref:Uncharacterized protein n=1 Tax=Elysia chlorotica TaxID=188477 RepID=A0A433T5T2_ELYCH|nr:hypothetical protein EGW08_015346 [Elysia chlorotica]